MIDNDRSRLQFQVNLFNKTVQINMNYNFLCEFGNVIDLDQAVSEKFIKLLDSMDDLMDNNKQTFADEFSIIKFHDIYQINLQSNYAKDIASAIGSVLSNVRDGCIKVDGIAVNVIFAFVKKLEIAAFNHYRELKDNSFSNQAKVMDIHRRGVRYPANNNRIRYNHG
jgi:hypothetical protein